MKIVSCLLLLIIAFVSCFTPTQNTEPKETKLSIEGTWKLLTGALVEKEKTTVTDYTKETSFIKVINGSHFAFLGHDLKKGKDSAAAFYSSGGGRFELADSAYTEHLEYCNDRQWEGNDFHFTIAIHKDTLIIKGVEKVEGTSIDRINTERYIRVKE